LGESGPARAENRGQKGRGMTLSSDGGGNFHKEGRKSRGTALNRSGEMALIVGQKGKREEMVTVGKVI